MGASTDVAFGYVLSQGSFLLLSHSEALSIVDKSEFFGRAHALTDAKTTERLFSHRYDVGAEVVRNGLLLLLSGLRCIREASGL